MISLVYITIVLSVLVEYLLVSGLSKNKSKNQVLAIIIVLLSISGSIFLLINKACPGSILLTFISLFRAVNMARVLKARMHIKELRRRALRTTSYLGVFTLLSLTGYIVSTNYTHTDNTMTYIAGIQLFVALLLAFSVVVARSVYRYRPSLSRFDKVPTVTVCIPARNETKDLPGCIESVLASLYPKLEILVLDDCSHDKTPDIIKKYAHEGVRFIKGKIPSDNWLAKNSAYDRLADESKSDILLFIGVDVRLKPGSITEIVGQMQNSDMISILPKRDVESEGSLFIQPIRYWWELGLWRFALSVPPVVSTCWAIRADALNSVGGFEGVKKAVEPESVFAKKFASMKKYSFLVANRTVGVTSIKEPSQQARTALRTRYVQMSSRPETVLKTMVLETLFVLGPYGVAFWAVKTDNNDIAIVSLASVLLLSLANAGVYKLVLRYTWPIGLLTAPFLVLADWILLARSMYAYEFNEVIWKERNICIPLLKVESHLPRID